MFDVAVSNRRSPSQWMVGGVLTVVGLAAVLCPVADAAISRGSEFAADRFAAGHGLAPDLVAALHALDDGSAARGWSRRLLSSHPAPDRRICAILTTTVYRHA